MPLYDRYSPPLLSPSSACGIDASGTTTAQETTAQKEGSLRPKKQDNDSRGAGSVSPDKSQSGEAQNPASKKRPVTLSEDQVEDQVTVLPKDVLLTWARWGERVVSIDQESHRFGVHNSPLPHQQAIRIHGLVNSVAQSFVADVVAAIGADISMTTDPQSLDAMLPQSDALLVNLGMLEQHKYDMVRHCVKVWNAVHAHHPKPWVLDPVKADMAPQRQALSHALLLDKPAIVRGNSKEIVALAHQPQAQQTPPLLRPLDKASTAFVSKINVPPPSIALMQDHCTRLALRSEQAVVVATGYDDVIAQGDTTTTVNYPVAQPLMARTVGTGCALSAIMTALCTIVPPYQAAHAAVVGARWSALCAGDRAHGALSFKIAWVDMVSALPALAMDALLSGRSGVS